ncbi:hypothetical protein WMY93_007358 [Mugilogobius chulae]|uniref:LRRNT domain-containing protein n=1 Tax=Mugilogobius chulae TaxID=88201 RepID=A0AAW0PLT1_9GOBI
MTTSDHDITQPTSKDPSCAPATIPANNKLVFNALSVNHLLLIALGLILACTILLISTLLLAWKVCQLSRRRKMLSGHSDLMSPAKLCMVYDKSNADAKETTVLMSNLNETRDEDGDGGPEPETESKKEEKDVCENGVEQKEKAAKNEEVKETPAAAAAEDSTSPKEEGEKSPVDKAETASEKTKDDTIITLPLVQTEPRKAAKTPKRLYRNRGQNLYRRKSTFCSWFGERTGRQAKRGGEKSDWNDKMRRNLLLKLSPNKVLLELLLLLLLLGRRVFAVCPSMCTCSRSHREVDCSWRGLRLLPDGLQYNLRTLNLSHNRFHNLDIHLTPYTHLRVLDLSYNRLTHLPAGLPRSLWQLYASYNRVQLLEKNDTAYQWNLQVLDLSYNKLERAVFINNTLINLRTLNLSHNNFWTMPTNMPAQLDTIDLSHNLLVKVLPGSLDRLPRLTQFYLQTNRFTTISFGVLDKLTSLRIIHLGVTHGLVIYPMKLLTFRLGPNKLQHGSWVAPAIPSLFVEEYVSEEAEAGTLHPMIYHHLQPVHKATTL